VADEGARISFIRAKGFAIDMLVSRMKATPDPSNRAPC